MARGVGSIRAGAHAIYTCAGAHAAPARGTQGEALGTVMVAMTVAKARIADARVEPARMASARAIDARAIDDG
ncbi:MAG TPA: hypothetical protein VNE82_11660 [Candidatus Binataceae bacterium]|nr:hypothetical protein [Candidatus Binataceae bacterium]